MVANLPAASTSDAKPDAMGRLINWLLPGDSPIFGDERDRLHWYEATDLVAAVQWFLLPWALAVMAWVAPVEAAPYVAVLYILFLLPLPLIHIHVRRQRVETEGPQFRTRLAILGTLAFWLPLPLIVFGLTVGLDLRTGTSLDDIQASSVDGLIGGGIGVATVLVVGAVQRHRKRHRMPATRPVDADDDE